MKARFNIKNTFEALKKTNNLKAATIARAFTSASKVGGFKLFKSASSLKSIARQRLSERLEFLDEKLDAAYAAELTSVGLLALVYAFLPPALNRASVVHATRLPDQARVSLSLLHAFSTHCGAHGFRAKSCHSGSLGRRRCQVLMDWMNHRNVGRFRASLRVSGMPTSK